MPHFIKTGYWKKRQKGLEGELNLELIIESSSTVPISDSTSISITSKKQSIVSDEDSISVAIPYSGDESTIELTLNRTSSSWTFPVGSLCVSEGVASSDNILILSGVSGDKYIIGIKKFGSSYYIVSKNFGQ